MRDEILPALAKKPRAEWTAEDVDAYERQNLYIARAYLRKPKQHTQAQLDWAQRIVGRQAVDSTERVVYRA